MKYLHLNEVNFGNYDVFGFDMDGTLYNELEFIKQVYKEISLYIQLHIGLNCYDYIYNWMVNRWVEKGSSYPYIFSEALEQFKITDDNLIKKCLNIYRNFKPDIQLNIAVEQTLNVLMKNNYALFLVTDGNLDLQKAKFNSLGLNKWFSEENIVFTEILGAKNYKPNIKALDYIACLTENKNNVLFIGDRIVDEQFALKAGFDFIFVDNFERFWEVKK